MHSEGSTRFGPSRYFLAWEALYNPFCALAILLGLFLHWKAATIQIGTLGGIAPKEWIAGARALYQWSKSCAISPEIWLALLAVGYGWLRYATTEYLLGESWLEVSSGWGCLSHPLRNQRNNIPLPTVMDCDTSTNIVQALLGAGTLILTYSDSGKPARLQLHWVPRAEQIHRSIVAQAGVRDARMIVN